MKIAILLLNAQSNVYTKTYRDSFTFDDIK